jgi:hypothetical protein
MGEDRSCAPYHLLQRSSGELWTYFFPGRGWGGGGFSPASHGRTEQLTRAWAMQFCRCCSPAIHNAATAVTASRTKTGLTGRSIVGHAIGTLPGSCSRTVPSSWRWSMNEGAGPITPPRPRRSLCASAGQSQPDVLLRQRPRSIARSRRARYVSEAIAIRSDGPLRLSRRRTNS